MSSLCKLELMCKFDEKCEATFKHQLVIQFTMYIKYLFRTPIL